MFILVDKLQIWILLSPIWSLRVSNKKHVHLRYPTKKHAGRHILCRGHIIHVALYGCQASTDYLGCNYSWIFIRSTGWELFVRISCRNFLILLFFLSTENENRWISDWTYAYMSQCCLTVWNCTCICMCEFVCACGFACVFWDIQQETSNSERYRSDHMLFKLLCMFWEVTRIL